jgi:hypothetical protein
VVQHAGIRGGLAGRTQSGSADRASIAFRFPSMCVCAFEGQKPRTLGSRSDALRGQCAREFEPDCVVPNQKLSQRSLCLFDIPVRAVSQPNWKFESDGGRESSG